MEDTTVITPLMARRQSPTARRLYYDTVGHGSEVALWAAYKAFGPDHLLAGSDYPITLYFEPYAANFDCIQRAEMSEDDKASILAGNAIHLLGLKVQAQASEVPVTSR